LKLRNSFNERAMAALYCSGNDFQLMVTKARGQIELFTYEHYSSQIQEKILLN
jgi:hypothetical protein